MQGEPHFFLGGGGRSVHETWKLDQNIIELTEKNGANLAKNGQMNETKLEILKKCCKRRLYSCRMQDEDLFFCRSLHEEQKS